MTQDACLFHDNLAVYESFGGIVLAPEEGANIAAALGPTKNAAILQNHGLLTLGKESVSEAVYVFQVLERMCKVQLLVEAAAANGLEKKIIDDDVSLAFSPSFIDLRYVQPLDVARALEDEKRILSSAARAARAARPLHSNPR